MAYIFWSLLVAEPHNMFLVKNIFIADRKNTNLNISSLRYNNLGYIQTGGKCDPNPIFFGPAIGFLKLQSECDTFNCFNPDQGLFSLWY